MTAYQATPATEAAYDLAEGILWDDRAGLVRWVDIWTGTVLSGELRNGRLESIAGLELGQTAGAVALAEDGGLLIAAARGLATVSPSGEVSIGPDLLADRTAVRFNDGSVDPQGRFVVGSCSLTGGGPGVEQLVRVSPDGGVELLRTELGLSNGIAFSPDGGIIYHVDTPARTVSSHSYGPGPFDSDEPWITVLDDLPAFPDGLTVDSTGALWVAQWGGGCARRYTPGGELLDVVEVDAAQASCPGFIGPDLTTLAITTAQEGLAEFDDQAGAVFLAEVGVAGLPPYRWAGDTAKPYWM